MNKEEVECLLAKVEDALAKLELEEEESQMYDLIGKIITPQNGKNYLAVSMRQMGDKYLYLLATVKKPLEMIVGDIRLSDGKFSMMEYTGSDYTEILNEFLSTILTDLETIKTKLG